MDKGKIGRFAAIVTMAGAMLFAQETKVEPVMGFEMSGARALDVGLTGPWGLAVDAAGQVYFSEPARGRVWRVTVEGVLQAAGEFEGAGAVAVDDAGNLFVAAATAVKRVDAVTGEVSTVVRVGEESGLKSIASMAWMGGGRLVVADIEARRLYGVDAVTGAVSLLAGVGKAGLAGDGGSALSATLTAPYRVAADAAGNVYYAERFEPVVRRVDAATGVMERVSLMKADEDVPGETEIVEWLAAGASGELYVSQTGRNRVLKVGKDGEVSVFAGTGSLEYNGDDRPAVEAAVPLPAGVAADAAGNVYVAQLLGPRVRRVDAAGAIRTIAGNGEMAHNGEGRAALETQLYEPSGVAVTATGDVYVASTLAHRVYKLSAAGEVTTVARLDTPQALMVDVNGDLMVAGDENRKLWRVLREGETRVVSELPALATAGRTLVRAAGGVVSDGTRIWATSPADHHVWVLEPGEEGGWKLKVAAGTGERGLTADEALAKESKLAMPAGLALSAEGVLYFAEAGNGRVRKVELATGLLGTVWGEEESRPSGVALDAKGGLWVADAGLGRLLRVELGTGKAEVVVQGLKRPTAVALDGEGRVCVAESGAQRVVRVSRQ